MLDTFHETLEKDDLLQYGIMGMHWGIRRSTQQLQAVRGKKKWEENNGGHVPLNEVTGPKGSQSAKAQKKADKIAVKNVKALSDSDRKALLKRLEEERTIKKYMQEDKSEVQKILESAVKAAGQKAVTTAINSAVATAAGTKSGAVSKEDAFNTALKIFYKEYTAKK